MVNIQKEIITALIVAGIYLLIFLIGEGLRRLIPLRNEISRKTVQLLSGLTALSFPYLFTSHWTVLTLSVSLCIIVFIHSRPENHTLQGADEQWPLSISLQETAGFSPRSFIMKRQEGVKSVYGVKRQSYGGIYYPAAVYLIFLLSSREQVIYFVAILVMTVSDSMAALVGGKYGTIKFDVEGNLKSLEGEIVFFFVTFLCIHLPILLLTDIGRAESVLIACIIAVLLTGFEAISLSGSGNIIVPLGTYFILAKFIKQPLNVVLWQAEILLMLIAAGLVMYIRPRLLRTSGLIAIIMLNYAALSLCNYYWFLPLFLAQIMYYILILSFVRYEGVERVASFQVKVLLYLGIIPTVFLFLANTRTDYMSFYLPYLTSITAQLAIIGNYFAQYVSRPIEADTYLKRHRRILEIICSVASTLFIAGMPIYLYKTRYRVNSLIIVVIGTWVAYILNFMMNKYYRGVKNDIFEYRRRFVSAAIGVAVVFILQKFISV